jgi:hypothetical protein
LNEECEKWLRKVFRDIHFSLFVLRENKNNIWEKKNEMKKSGERFYDVEWRY